MVLDDLHAVHKSRRNRSGRVRQKSRSHVADKTELNRYIATTKKHVGWLAAGWNAAALKLGYRPPAWILRHRSGQGSVRVSVRGKRLSVTMSNRVGYAGNISNLRRRIDTALLYQGKKMNRMTKHILEKAARRAGFR